MASLAGLGTTGETAYVVIERIDGSDSGKVWDAGSEALDTYDSSDIDDYDIAATEEGTASGRYAVTVPSSLPGGRYRIIWRIRAGGSPTESDSPFWEETIDWDGSNIVGLTTATSELTDVPTSTSSALTWMLWIGALCFHRRRTNKADGKTYVYQSDGSTVLGEVEFSDNGSEVDILKGVDP
ncbi:hypothetical protein Pan216_21010 [Planctomycetes bacterium Pan216]|uniref:Uncharacterized protein n=1 Tax=Kolteria novifilia TaxID=2527975 RepID=A0A518B2N3_9BACT|nr:hypothetical protein Pan216_21010 [Planctomycetes bacterium Pan216]